MYCALKNKKSFIRRQLILLSPHPYMYRYNLSRRQKKNQISWVWCWYNKFRRGHILRFPDSNGLLKYFVATLKAKGKLQNSIPYLPQITYAF
jgi:hypothetical protein